MNSDNIEDHRPAWCFVLPWSLKGLHGGVNQVVVNLLREFESDPACIWRTLAMETDWKPEVVEDPTVCATEVIKFRLRVPFTDENTLLTTLAFLIHLPAELFRLRALAKRRKIEVFNVHYVDAEALTFAILKAMNWFEGKLIFSLHGSDLRKGFQKRGVRRWLWKWMLRSADVVVACSEGLREETLMLESKANVITIYNGIDVVRFSANSRNDFTWPVGLKDRKVVIQIGSFQHRKGHDLLVRAFRLVHDRHPDSALVLIGEKGPVMPDIRGLIVELKLTESVWLLEDVSHSQIFDYLRLSTVFVLASRWKKGIEGEGFAIALLEAGAAQVPVVATASCGVPEIIEDGVTGRLAPLEDVNAISNAICEMLENSELAAGTAKNLHILVTEQFTWRRAEQSYLAAAGG